MCRDVDHPALEPGEPLVGLGGVLDTPRVR